MKKAKSVKRPVLTEQDAAHQVQKTVNALLETINKLDVNVAMASTLSTAAICVMAGGGDRTTFMTLCAETWDNVGGDQ